MKKAYEAPKAEKVEFDYTEVVATSASHGCKYRLYIEGDSGCNKTPTDIWIGDGND